MHNKTLYAWTNLRKNTSKMGAPFQASDSSLFNKK